VEDEMNISAQIGTSATSGICVDIRLIFVSLIAFVLCGCELPADKRTVDELSARLDVSERRIASLERAVADLPARSGPVANWVLWKRDQALCSNCLYNAPRPISAYTSRVDCVNAATKLIDVGGKLISADPIEIAFGAERRLYFHCLPPGVDAGK
jgi:hypothetical protein